MKLPNLENWNSGVLSKSAKIWLSKSIFYVKNHFNLSQFFFVEEYQFRSTFFVIDIFWKFHNPYCHTVTIWHYLCSNCRPWNSKKLIVEQRIIQVKVRFCKEAMKTWWNLPLLLWLYYYTHVASRKQNWKISSCFF